MQKITFFNILFLSSLLLLYPLIQPNEEMTILPDTPLIFQKNVNTPKLTFELKEQDLILMNISKVDINHNSTTLLYENLDFNSQITIEFNNPGIYVFEVISLSINTLIIISDSIYPASIFIIITVGLVNVILIYLNRKEEIL